ncbi:MAG: glycosyltransferase [Thermoproteota archaeon]
MLKFYNMVDLEVLPSLTEGFPSVILEAYAYEKPVLASVEAFPKELELFGAFASFEMFEEKIRELQQADLRGIGRLARNCVKKNFAWEQFAKAVTYYLEKAI